MKKIAVIMIAFINLTAYDFGQDVNIIGKWEIISKDMKTINLASTVGNKWEYEFGDDGFIYETKTGERKSIKWSYTTQEGVINIQFYVESDNKPISNFFGGLASHNLKIVKRLEYNKYLVKIQGSENEIIMRKIGESQKKTNNKIKKTIDIKISD